MFDAFERQFPRHWSRLIVRYPADLAANHDAYVQYALSQLPSDGTSLVVAESFSSAVAVRMAHGLRDRLLGLVICAGFISPPHALLPLLRRVPPKVFPLARRIRPLLRHFCLDAQSGTKALDELQSALRLLDGRVAQQRLNVLSSLDANSAWRGLTVPTLALQASKDRLVDRRAQLMLEQTASPSTKMVTLDGPHFLLQARPTECWRAVAEWLDELHLADDLQQN